MPRKAKQQPTQRAASSVAHDDSRNSVAHTAVSQMVEAGAHDNHVSDDVAIIKEVLAGLRGYVQGDGGDVAFVAYQDSIVKIKLSGACVGCPSSFFTVKFGIEEAIKQRLPHVKEVMLVE